MNLPSVDRNTGSMTFALMEHQSLHPTKDAPMQPLATTTSPQRKMMDHAHTPKQVMTAADRALSTGVWTQAHATSIRQRQSKLQMTSASIPSKGTLAMESAQTIRTVTVSVMKTKP